MQEETIYEKTKKTITDLFREESVSLLTEEQIQDALSAEQVRLTRAESAGIPCRQWMGMNIQRYSKELLRRHQPFYAGYSLLGFCTEVSCDLLFFYVIQWIVIFLTGADIRKPLTAVPILLIIYVLWKNIAASHTRNLLTDTQISTDMLSGRAKRFRFITGIIFFGIAVLILSLFQGIISTALMHIELIHVFFAYILMIILYGIHNVIYSSHCILFFAVGVFSVDKRFADRKNDAMKWYITQKQKRSPEPLRPHLVSMRIYIVLALFILVILDIVCVFNLIKNFSISVLILGLTSLVLTAIFAVAFLGCQSLISYPANKSKTDPKK